MNNVNLKAELTDVQAWTLAQLLKRFYFSDYRSKASSDAEAYQMREAAETLRLALAEEGYDPR